MTILYILDTVVVVVSLIVTNIHTERHILQLKNKLSALWWTNDVNDGMSDKP